ncbi:glycoside hydrolase domain-containing protein [Bacillus cereus]
MSNNFWGVDSCEPANAKRQATNNKFLLEYVQDELGQPDFWGRYLTTPCGPNGVLTSEEIIYLKNNGVRIMPIYNSIDPYNMNDHIKGANDADKAINIASRLGILNPTKIIIYLDIEQSYKPTADYLKGWSETFFKRSDTEGVLPGFYCNTVTKNFLDPFCNAISDNPNLDSPVAKTVLYTTQPQLSSCLKKDNIPDWAPTQPTCLVGEFIDKGVQVWQYKIQCLENKNPAEATKFLVDLDEMTQYAFDHTFG